MIRSAMQALRQRSAAAFSRCSLPLLGGSGHHQNGMQNRTMITKAMRDDDFVRPKPFPYREKPYSGFQSIFDDTTQRFDENTKIIVVDGPPTGNKDKFARELASEFDMLYIPCANLDPLFINDYGFDRRTLNHKVPYSTRSFEVHEFLQNPYHGRSTRMQFNMQYIRFNQYIEAINHLMNTGQGVVMHRSIYSDLIFMETMTQLKFTTENAFTCYKECMFQGMHLFLKPHLFIYLDIPVDQILKNLKARDRPEECNSPFLTKEALTLMTANYKRFISDMSEHSEVLVYDWTEEGDANFIVDDLARIDFDRYDQYDKKLSDWRFKDEAQWKNARVQFSSHKDTMNDWLAPSKLTVPELIRTGEETKIYYEVLEEEPTERYAYGYNAGDGSNFFRLSAPVRYQDFYSKYSK